MTPATRRRRSGIAAMADEASKSAVRALSRDRERQLSARAAAPQAELKDRTQSGLTLEDRHLRARVGVAQALTRLGTADGDGLNDRFTETVAQMSAKDSSHTHDVIRDPAHEVSRDRVARLPGGDCAARALVYRRVPV